MPTSRDSQVVSRTVSDGTNSYTWNYTYGSGTGPQGNYNYTVVTDPNHNDTLHLFSGPQTLHALGPRSKPTTLQEATRFQATRGNARESHRRRVF